jgi:hypothetical protein
MQQVKDSPDVDTDQPVSRQIEIHVYNYYGWDPYWGSSLYPISNAIAIPLVAPLHLLEAKPRDPDEGDPHLRSIAAVTGDHIHATDGEIGHVEDFLVDDADWSIRCITVDTRNWWPGERVLISPRSVREIDWANRRFTSMSIDRRSKTVHRPMMKHFLHITASGGLPLEERQWHTAQLG